MATDTQQRDEWDIPWDDDGVTESDLGGGKVEQEGWYHFSIVSVKQDLEIRDAKGNTQAPHILFNCKVEKGEPGKAKPGSMVYHRLNVRGKGNADLEEFPKKMILSFARGLGVAKYVEERDASGNIKLKGWFNDAGEKFNPGMLLDVEGKQFIAKVVCRKWDTGSKSGESYEFPASRVYHPEDPQVASRPMDLEILQVGGYDVKKIVANQQAAGVSGGGDGDGGSGKDAGEPDNF